MKAQVDQEFLPCVSTALLRGRTVVDRFCYGHADREAGVALREDHIFRMFSSTKLVTSCAVMMLVEDGRIRLEDPVEKYIPELANRQVLRPGATSLADTEPARSAITLQHLMTHTSGLSYGLFDPGTLLYTAYNGAGVRNMSQDLGAMMTALAPLPLSFHPGTQWEYSVATDVLGRVVEVVTGERFGRFLSHRIFEPLGMADTDFWVPPEKRDRLCALYVGVDLADPTRPGLLRADASPYPGAYLSPPARDSGGGGLVSTLDDSIRLIQSLVPDPAGGPTLLQPATVQQMFSNQLPPGMHVQFPNVPTQPGWRFGLGSAVRDAAAPTDPKDIPGEVSWGGLAGTLWWIHPRLGIAAVLMTQRYFGFGNAYAQQFKVEAYSALLG
ncbi:MAG: beta-lactamase family protein [Gammaproteobacteria bacterium]|nr:beta-lactamase family protein [Gammaproteobacteria bacterium]